MERPSDHWQGFAAMSLDSEKHKRIELLLSTANFEHLKIRAIESRRKHQPDVPEHVDCSIDLTHFASGFDNLVLELAFSDNVFWLVRIPHQILDDDDKTSMLSEIATMKIVKKFYHYPDPSGL